jgi:CRISPR/Cas system-associated endoribonuclease Cas2
MVERRGRKTTATHIYEKIGDDYDDMGLYLVLYDFELHAGEVVNHAFFKNINRILDMGDGVRVQRSVIECKHLRTARAIEALCRHYSPDDRGLEVLIYEVKKKLENIN